MKQCDSYSTTVEAQCCYVEGHSGECFYSRQDETDRIRWKLAADERDRWRAQFVALRSDLARVTQERDEALREVQRKGAREIGLLSRALAAETQSDITQDALTAMRQERDALSAQLTTAVRDARATAAGDIQRAEAERDAALSDLAKMDKEQNELHALLKAVVDFALDEAGFPASAMIGPDAPLRIVRKLHADLTAMRHRAERAEAELTEVVDAVIGAPQNTAVIAAVERRIAAWLLGPDAANLTSVDLTDPVCPRGTTLTIAADAIRAGTWRTP
jgi:hypothetical protein